jgi:anaerobic magnesium-protoporphyrin IX monomethyl ester cyclase
MPHVHPPARRPRAVLIGADHEENLSLRYVAGAARAAGIETEILPFNEAADEAAVCRATLACRPFLVGISMPFQARAAESLGLALKLRAAGYQGHITIGGHFPTFEYDSILRDHPAVDSVVRHEGEVTFCDLASRLSKHETIGDVRGLVSRAGERLVVAERRPLSRLDELPFPDRRGDPERVLGIACAPIVASRGCYADCSFCCINAFSQHADGPRFRRRSPENVAREMAQEYRERGVRLFIFHDDNFFVPHPPSNQRRYRRLADCLREEGLRGIGLVIKCRPNDVEEEMFSLLQELGLLRAYVGIESNSQEGLVSLNRRISQADNRRALGILGRLGIYHSFNLLIFDPEATLDGVRANLDFMEEFAGTPSNFCRAEVYAGTPLKDVLARQERLTGSYMAWGYAMRSAPVEMLFRIASTAFAPRNLKADGVASLNMGLRFDAEVLRHFYPDRGGAAPRRPLEALSREVALDSVAHMRRALEFVSGADLLDDRACRDFTVELARSVAGKDLGFLTAIRSYRRQMEEAVGTSRTPAEAPSAEAHRAPAVGG